VDRPVRDGGLSTPGLVAVFSEVGPLAQVHPVPGPRTLGRDATSSIVVDDVKVSREHAVVERRSDGLTLRDLSSRNGSFVDGDRVGGQTVALPAGSLLRLGRTLFISVDACEPLHGFGVPRAGPLVGGPALDPVRDEIGAIARSNTSVFIDGPTGSGKELAAQAVHEESGRRGSLVGVNCGALPSDLMESELFGHVRGAFSGSERSREGLVRRARGGSLFLDEVGDLPLQLQVKLLRVLESGEVRAVGEDAPQHVDVRWIAATNRPPEALIAAGALREDLFHRLCAVRITMPSLIAHREDIPALARSFAGEMSFSVLAMEALLLYDWPGNVRELKNCVTAALARARSQSRDQILPADIKLVRNPTSEPPRSGRPAEGELRVRIETALQAHAGNVKETAKSLKMARSVLYDWLKRLAIDPARYRG
jgi:DNA-binding NtrC family response regulator